MRTHTAAGTASPWALLPGPLDLPVQGLGEQRDLATVLRASASSSVE